MYVEESDDGEATRMCVVGWVVRGHKSEERGTIGRCGWQRRVDEEWESFSVMAFWGHALCFAGN
jgi:hypothetical protein